MRWATAHQRVSWTLSIHRTDSRLLPVTSRWNWSKFHAPSRDQTNKTICSVRLTSLTFISLEDKHFLIRQGDKHTATNMTKSSPIDVNENPVSFFLHNTVDGMTKPHFCNTDSMFIDSRVNVQPRFVQPALGKDQSRPYHPSPAPSHTVGSFVLLALSATRETDLICFCVRKSSFTLIQWSLCWQVASRWSFVSYNLTGGKRCQGTGCDFHFYSFRWILFVHDDFLCLPLDECDSISVLDQFHLGKSVLDAPAETLVDQDWRENRDVHSTWNTGHRVEHRTPYRKRLQNCPLLIRINHRHHCSVTDLRGDPNQWWSSWIDSSRTPYLQGESYSEEEKKRAS